ncbi:DUF4442 domain-containing protein [Chitinophaga lutea]
MADTVSTTEFIRLANTRWKFSLYLLKTLPSAWLAGVRVHSMDELSCSTVVPYRWLSQNPFRSTYFACLAMAAEMSSGLLAMAHVAGAGARVSMLVTGMEAIFIKKAKSRTWFTCDAGDDIQRTIRLAVDSGDPSAITIVVAGKSEDGTEVARFHITWSFKKA